MILNTEAQLPILREAPILRGSAAMVPDPSLLTLHSSRQSHVTYCGSTTNTARSADTEPKAPILYTFKLSEIAKLCGELTLSLKTPSRRTLRLIERALSYLTPFESPLAVVTSASEKEDLLELLDTHHLTLSPYLDLDRIERNLRHRH